MLTLFTSSWVFSESLPDSTKSGHTIYTPSSDGVNQTSWSWSIGYQDGSSASGSVYLDHVTFGEYTVAQQAVEAATQVSSSFAQEGSDGLMGLSFSSANMIKPTPQNTWFDNVKTQLPSKLFVAILKHNVPGEYDFGFLDDSKYSGDITYTSVDSSQGYWGFTVDGYGVGSASPSSSSINAIADTGTSLLMVDDSVCSAYWGQVDGSFNDPLEGGYLFPCSASLPSITFTINGYSAVVSGDLLNYEEIGDGYCMGGLASNEGSGMSIFGDVFLKSQYVVFDSDGPQLGFAPQA